MIVAPPVLATKPADASTRANHGNGSSGPNAPGWGLFVAFGRWKNESSIHRLRGSRRVATASTMCVGTGSSAAAATIAAVARGSRRGPELVACTAEDAFRTKAPLVNCGGARWARHSGAPSQPAPRSNGVGDESVTCRDHAPSKFL